MQTHVILLKNSMKYSKKLMPVYNLYHKIKQDGESHIQFYEASITLITKTERQTKKQCKEESPYLVFMLTYSHTMKRAQCLLRPGHLDQWNIIRNPEIDLNQYAQLFLTKVQKHFNGGRMNSHFNKPSWSDWISIVKKINLGLNFIPYATTNAKWITNLIPKAR